MNKMNPYLNLEVALGPSGNMTPTVNLGPKVVRAARPTLPVTFPIFSGLNFCKVADGQHELAYYTRGEYIAAISRDLATRLEYEVTIYFGGQVIAEVAPGDVGNDIVLDPRMEIEEMLGKLF